METHKETKHGEKKFSIEKHIIIIIIIVIIIIIITMVIFKRLSLKVLSTLKK